MPGCCEPGDLDRIFSPQRAERDARSYRRKGLGGQSRWIVDALRPHAAGRTVLEVGGGIGAIQMELLRAGALGATNVELSRGYEDVARALLRSAGLEAKVERRVGDFVTEAPRLPATDLVVLDRVVCCYPDAAALVGEAAAHARELLALTFPVDRRLAQLVAMTINVGPRLMRSRFRFFIHHTRDVRGYAERGGMRLVAQRRGIIWQMLVFAR